MEKYNPNGYFPLVIILSNNEKILGKLGYENISPEDYAKKINSFTAK